MKIILGTAQLTKDYGLEKKKLNIKEFIKIKKTSLARNNNYIDTALSYSGVDDKLSKLNIKGFNIITKIPSLDINKNTYKKTIEALRKSKEKLKINKFYAVLLHNEKDLIGKNKLENFNFLKKIKRMGLTKKIGISCYSKKNLDKVLNNFKIDVIQVPGNLFDQRFVNNLYLEKIKKLRVEIHVRSIFLQGVLIKKKLFKSLRFKNNINEVYKTYDMWTKINKIDKISLCLNFISSFNIKFLVVGITSHRQFKQIINFKHNSKINFPKFNKNQKDNNKLIRPDLWSKR